MRSLSAIVVICACLASACAVEDTTPIAEDEAQRRSLGGQGAFRTYTFGDDVHWTNTLRMHEVIASSVGPATALGVGFKLDSDALPPGFLETADVQDPATTVALLRLDAVVGVRGRVARDGTLESVGITCAFCHSTVDDSVAPGIGRRLDGWPNRDLDPGLVLSWSPSFTDAQREVLRSWGPGRYDPRWNIDGVSAPVLIPPLYGLAGVPAATYTGDSSSSYWSAYAAITQMGGFGSFADERIGVTVARLPDLVSPVLPALLEYQQSLRTPPPPEGTADARAAARGRIVFDGQARCASCHTAPTFTDAARTLHAPEETGMDERHATRSATGMYRTTPLRGLWQHPPYFHDGSAATLGEVVAHYDGYLGLGLSDAQRSDLVEYLLTL